MFPRWWFGIFPQTITGVNAKWQKVQQKRKQRQIWSSWSLRPRPIRSRDILVRDIVWLPATVIFAICRRARLGWILKTIFKRDILTFAARVLWFVNWKKRQRQRIVCIWRRTLTARERPLHGIWQRHWIWMKTRHGALRLTKWQNML